MRTALTALALVLLPLAATAQPGGNPSRGELLYAHHCVACHNSQMHWRDQRLARDWTTLVAQVRRWQGVASLQWSDAEVEDVARYLNDRIYGFEPATRTTRR